MVSIDWHLALVFISSKPKEDFNSLLENLEWFQLTSPLGVPGCSNHIIGIRLNTNTWVFKCALTCTHSIVGWGFSLPYHRTSITSGRSHYTATNALGRRFIPMSLSLCLYINMSVTENKNSSSLGGWYNNLIWGCQLKTYIIIDAVPSYSSNFNRAGLTRTSTVWTWWKSASISTTCGPIHSWRALGKSHAPLFQT